jgi:hypothetical protein
MTSGQATFGDLFRLAGSELAGARTPAQTVTPGRDAAEVSTGILHVINVLTRYTADETRMIRRLPDRHLAVVSPWDRAGVQTHDLLASAGAVLRPSGMRVHGRGGEAGSLPARKLHSAATALDAARDLLQSHFVTHRSGARIGYSGWAAVIVSPAVTRAQLTEVASIARQSAAVGEASLRAGYPLPEVGDRLVTACQLLDQAASSIDQAGRSEPVNQADRDLLYAIPVNAMPPRSLVADPESVPALCQAVITTAERARHAAWTAAGQHPHSTAVSIASWQRIASAAMVTSHHCQVLCGTLADATSGHRARALHANLAQAAGQAGSARDAWLDAAREYEEITTDIRDHMSPAAAEAAELALWSGRLAYAGPDWNISSGPSHPARPAEALAPEAADVPEVVAAIHHASEAVAQLATANLEQAKSAVRGDRVLVATRFLPENYDIPSPYTPAPASYQTSLLMCCSDTSDAARQLSEAVREIAIETRAPSQTLVTAKHVVQQLAVEYSRVVGGPEPGKTRADAPGPVESELRGHGVTDPRALWRAAALDRASRQLVAEAAPRRAQREGRTAQAPTTPTAARVASRFSDARRAEARTLARDQPVREDFQAEP